MRIIQTTAKAMVFAVTALGCLAAIVGLGWLLFRTSTTPSANQAVIEHRLQLLSNVQAANDLVLQTYDWQNKDKGCIRVPIERAKQLMLQEWQDPAAGRSNLLARAAVVLAVPPPPEAQPNPYE